MHPKIEQQIEEYKKWVKEVKEHEQTCYQIDKLIKKITQITGLNNFDYSVYSSRPVISIWIEHVKRISEILIIFSKEFGKIKYWDVKPEKKDFNFTYDKIQVRFFLIGDSCKLVKVDEKTVDVFELRCNNGKETIINEDYIQV